MIDTKKIKDVLARAYQVLDFSADEIEQTTGDLLKTCQNEASAEMLKILTEDDIATLSDVAEKDNDEKAKAMQQITQNHKNDENCKNLVEGAFKKVIGEHIDYLKTCGTEEQSEAIAEILSELEEF